MASAWDAARLASRRPPQWRAMTQKPLTREAILEFARTFQPKDNT